jgi:FKBP-type peptidyl-prolyl cis-trans isomerase
MLSDQGFGNGKVFEMPRPVVLGLALLATASAWHTAPAAAAMDTRPSATVTLPGPSYEVLRSGPPAGVRPTRDDQVEIRYVGRLLGGDVFSTSENDGVGTSLFSVRTVIPGFSALVQMMRPGDRWRFTIPSYLAYGPQGRRHRPPEPTLKRDVPPGSTLVFDVELVAVRPSGT